MSTPVKSRHLRPSTLNELGERGAIDTEVTFERIRLPLRIEIAFPEKFGEGAVNDIDMVLDNLNFVDSLGRETIARGVNKQGSTAAQLFRAWEQKKTVGWENSTDDFIRDLKLTHIFIMPDGGIPIPDRVISTYQLSDSGARGAIKVRFLEPLGPQLAPA